MMEMPSQFRQALTQRHIAAACHRKPSLKFLLRASCPAPAMGRLSLAEFTSVMVRSAHQLGIHVDKAFPSRSAAGRRRL